MWAELHILIFQKNCTWIEVFVTKVHILVFQIFLFLNRSFVTWGRRISAIFRDYWLINIHQHTNHTDMNPLLAHKSYRHEPVACSVSKWFADQNWRHNRVPHAESNIWASCTRTLLQWFADQKYHRNRAAHKLIFEQVRLFLSSFSSRNSHNKMIAALSCP